MNRRTCGNNRTVGYFKWYVPDWLPYTFHLQCWFHPPNSSDFVLHYRRPYLSYTNRDRSQVWHCHQTRRRQHVPSQMNKTTITLIVLLPHTYVYGRSDWYGLCHLGNIEQTLRIVSDANATRLILHEDEIDGTDSTVRFDATDYNKNTVTLCKKPFLTEWDEDEKKRQKLRIKHNRLSCRKIISCMQWRKTRNTAII